MSAVGTKIRREASRESRSATLFSQKKLPSPPVVNLLAPWPLALGQSARGRARPGIRLLAHGTPFRHLHEAVAVLTAPTAFAPDLEEVRTKLIRPQPRWNIVLGIYSVSR